ncbi:MAG TPA: hypothetical protein VM680_20055 [Verrucomicrobiae bacterium]|nr:hypothetical protein [Verrucomicrobiae bacterium]
METENEAAMIQKGDVRTKTDVELLQIWREQIDYREDVVAWVKDEIAVRNLDTSSLHIDTLDEKLKSESLAGTFKWLLIVAVFQGLMGIEVIFAGASALIDAIKTSRGFGFSMAFPVVGIALGSLLTALAVGVAKRRKWAFTGSFVLCVLNIAFLLLLLRYALTEPFVLVVVIFHIVTSGLLARCYLRMRRTCPANTQVLSGW